MSLKETQKITDKWIKENTGGVLGSQKYFIKSYRGARRAC